MPTLHALSFCDAHGRRWDFHAVALVLPATSVDFLAAGRSADFGSGRARRHHAQCRLFPADAHDWRAGVSQLGFSMIGAARREPSRTGRRAPASRKSPAGSRHSPGGAVAIMPARHARHRSADDDDDAAAAASAHRDPCRGCRRHTSALI